MMASMPRLRFLSGVLLVAVLTASGTLRGLCFMPGTGEAGPRDAHACCKKGWTARPPECCMSSLADEEAGRVVAAPTLGPPRVAAVSTAFLPPAVPTHAVSAAADRSHSPPGPHPLRV
jgi:hypothetical protein